MSILFINGSPNKNGNTAALAAELLKDHEYETLNLTDYTIGAYGQNLPGDGLDAVIGAMKQADTIVIGSPLYWHNICGSVRNVLDRFYGKVEDGELSGRKLYFVFQGAASIFPELRPETQNTVCVSGRSSGKMDAGGGRVHDEALRRPLRYDLRRHGNQQK